MGWLITSQIIPFIFLVKKLSLGVCMTFTSDSRVIQWLTRDQESEVYARHNFPSPKVGDSDIFSASSCCTFLPISSSYFCASCTSIDPSSYQFWWFVIYHPCLKKMSLWVLFEGSFAQLKYKGLIFTLIFK